MYIETNEKNEIRSQAFLKLSRMLSADIDLRHHESIKKYTALFSNSDASEEEKVLIKIQYVDYLIKMMDTIEL